MTAVQITDKKAVIHKNRDKHYFHKFKGFGIQFKDLCEIREDKRNIKKIAIIIDNGSEKNISALTLVILAQFSTKNNSHLLLASD